MIWYIVTYRNAVTGQTRRYPAWYPAGADAPDTTYWQGAVLHKESVETVNEPDLAGVNPTPVPLGLITTPVARWVEAVLNGETPPKPDDYDAGSGDSSHPALHDEPVHDVPDDAWAVPSTGVWEEP